MNAQSRTWKETLKNLPNKLTLFRVAVIPAMCLLYPWDFRPLNLLSTLLFALGAISDFLDGYLARRMNNVTRIGEILDPISDKLLVAAALIVMTDAHVITGWITVLILCREFAVSGLRLASLEQGLSIKVSGFGKIKTALQDVAIILLMTRIEEYHTVGMLTLWVSIIFSYYSAYQYGSKFWEESRQHFS